MKSLCYQESKQHAVFTVLPANITPSQADNQTIKKQTRQQNNHKLAPFLVNFIKGDRITACSAGSEESAADFEKQRQSKR